MLEVNNKDTRTTPCFTPLSVSIFNFEQANGGWVLTSVNFK